MSQYFTKCGFTVPQDTMYEGNWESPTFCKLNDLILKENGMWWQRVDINKELKISDNLHGIIKSWLEINPNLEVVKDPRLCITYPVWQQIFPKCNFIFTLRGPFNCCESLTRKEEVNSDCQELWYLYYINVLKIAEKLDNPSGVEFTNDIFEYTDALRSVLLRIGIATDKTVIDKVYDISKIHCTHSVCENALEKSVALYNRLLTHCKM